jgi:dTDP-4-amino-4,6-dideoxygalactose transaminase
MPVYLQPYYRDLGYLPGFCPEAERYAQEAITLPLYPAMDDGVPRRVAGVLEDLLA